MDTKLERVFEIMNGPGRDRLFDALKYAYDGDVRINLDFSVASGYTQPRSHPGCAYYKMPLKNIILSSLEHGDGSGMSFNLAGFCEANPEAFGDQAAKCTPHQFKAYYNAKTRTGVITFARRTVSPENEAVRHVSELVS